MKSVFYFHGGSKNHGCEAIVRSIVKLLGGQYELFSNQPQEDYIYGLNNICQIKHIQKPLNRRSLLYWIAFYRYYFLNDKEAYDCSLFNSLYNSSKKATFTFSIGGDNYCYKVPSYMYIINKKLKEIKAKTILIGCSIEEDFFSKENFIDIKQYSYIIPRESITYHLLIQKGFKNISLFPDPAFILDRKDLPLPQGFAEFNTVGINLSPLIMNNEKINGITLKNYIALIRYILEHTDMQIALIPHVVWEQNDDRKPLSSLYQEFKDTGRVVFIADHNAEELKGFIARCRFLVAARTHASIAAYSTQVPTLVIGYSVKARGIARDLFGDEEHYVLPVQSLQKEDELVKKFQWLQAHEKEIRQHYQAFMPQYIGKLNELKTKLNELL